LRDVLAVGACRATIRRLNPRQRTRQATMGRRSTDVTAARSSEPVMRKGAAHRATFFNTLSMSSRLSAEFSTSLTQVSSIG
jgi:hypothetical protein